ncbi:hypothetical protein H112_06382 [Trichophyton rubrum D6]|uniref:Hyphal anastamosis-8 protein n=3 Tax=Trichophyton TaxID=5550 RepID=F2SHS3_TRIRC|nr:uncharacterized protein TERG_01749 [Trichophyton rubrum CBS 118892]EZF13236.1 hypothetical protein H100_06397 [Trichophyton rubrum MR850]EZF39463.1 hypothetical protein H102_06363 [Trichophyton rubrum CBS 100081]EZF50290.1 hypothetical protein H103_06389 [Trichophyton rubrum CBS 288.86]EZF60921.1 hypothetical protein H104_06375 [Trichophyton rubrum CBS 289.86]EZF71438.1 hypothetical protein H105_06402 [Trichophyton soudanense CBS 452.61]EZF82248.1 hypothetical protein H110_06385 [Trichophy
MSRLHPNDYTEGSEHSFSQDPVTPVDVVQPTRKQMVGFAAQSTTMESSNRDPPSESPFADPPAKPGSLDSNKQPNVSDVGFGYVSDNRPDRDAPGSSANAPNSPLKSAMKVPGTPGRFGNANPLSPTFREEQILEIHEKDAEEENAKDLKIKTRVRLSKILLRGVNLSCSLIVLALLAQSFIIFRATRHLESRNGLTPWDPNTNAWPQILILVLTSINMFLSLVVLWNNCCGKKRRAEKVNVYYTLFAGGFFVFTVIMWVIAAGLLQNSKDSGNGKDLWGWSCKDNQRATLFKELVDYALVCRMQDWTLVCIIIEIVVDTITIAIYAVVFYRFYSKRKLRKSMNVRDKARSDLYLANLRVQTAPNTPGFARSPAMKQNPYSAAENGQSNEFYQPQYATSVNTTTNKPFQLQPPPSRSSNSIHNAPRAETQSPALEPGSTERANHHVAVAPGEQSYGAVPIPEPYRSPSFAPQGMTLPNTPSIGVAVSSDNASHARNSSK